MNQLNYNPLLDTDSYKLSHWPQYPQGMTSMFSYLESRGGEFAESTLFGTQWLVQKYLSQRFTIDDLQEAVTFAAAHGEPFNVQGCKDMHYKYNGYFPVRIRAIPEGTVVPTGNVLMTVESTDPEFAWVVNYLETMLARLWYPSTVAMQSREMRKTILGYLRETSDDPEGELPFKLHDFGARGVSCHEQAGIGGAAHLATGAQGSDTIEGVRVANHYYDCAMSGFSLPATEHSTITSHGKINEYFAFTRYVDKFLTNRQVPAGVPKLAACVSDSYNVFEACKFWCSPVMRQTLKDSGGTLIIRPDSGDPCDTLRGVFNVLEQELGSEITLNSKGFKMLPPYLRVIQGDGIDRDSLKAILSHICRGRRWSASNLAFGSGGGLLQKVNRDTQKFAFKCSSVTVDGTQRDVFKDPVTDQGKRSKRGRMDLLKLHDGSYMTGKLIPDGLLQFNRSELVTVYENGPTSYRTTLEEVRARMALK